MGGEAGWWGGGLVGRRVGGDERFLVVSGIGGWMERAGDRVVGGLVVGLGCQLAGFRECPCLKFASFVGTCSLLCQSACRWARTTDV